MTQIRFKSEAEYVVDMAEQLQERTGQFLFNYLRHEITEIIRGTKFDTFYQDMSYEEVVRWLENHIEYDKNGNMISFHNGDDILWEKR